MCKKSLEVMIREAKQKGIRMVLPAGVRIPTVEEFERDGGVYTPIALDMIENAKKEFVAQQKENEGGLDV